MHLLRGVRVPLNLASSTILWGFHQVFTNHTGGVLLNSLQGVGTVVDVGCWSVCSRPAHKHPWRAQKTERSRRANVLLTEMPRTGRFFCEPAQKRAGIKHRIELQNGLAIVEGSAQKHVVSLENDAQAQRPAMHRNAKTRTSSPRGQ